MTDPRAIARPQRGTPTTNQRRGFFSALAALAWLIAATGCFEQLAAPSPAAPEPPATPTPTPAPTPAPTFEAAADRLHAAADRLTEAAAPLAEAAKALTPPSAAPAIDQAREHATRTAEEWAEIIGAGVLSAGAVAAAWRAANRSWDQATAAAKGGIP